MCPYCVCNELGIFAMGAVVVTPVEDAHRLVIFVRQVVEELAEA